MYANSTVDTCRFQILLNKMWLEGGEGSPVVLLSICMCVKSMIHYVFILFSVFPWNTNEERGYHFHAHGPISMQITAAQNNGLGLNSKGKITFVCV